LAPPEELRRLAVGGDRVEVVTSGSFDPWSLEGLAVVRSIERLDGHRMRFTVDDAATGLPDVVEAIRARGGDVTAAEVVSPSFDDVFAILVEHDRAAPPTPEQTASEEAA
jgi:hypothetical protein